jgi:glycosyltransferase involved in cell wall biosynthesis
VIHEGIDTAAIAPNPNATVTLQRQGLNFRPGAELVTFVARSLEPYRGVHTFLRSLPLLQRLRPAAHVIVVGGDGVSYGLPPASGACEPSQARRGTEGTSRGASLRGRICVHAGPVKVL